MTKKKEKTEAGAIGEQGDLIDIHPENAKAIIQGSKLYKKYQLARLSMLAKETDQKKKVLALIKAAKLQPLEDGKIKFEYDGFVISVTPRDELLSIKDKTEE